MGYTETEIFAKEAKGWAREDIMQAHYIQWAWETYPELSTRLFHIENEGNTGGKKGAMQGAIALTKGKLSGVYDNLDVITGVWLELKLKGNKLSPAQQRLYEIWTLKGVKIYIIEEDFRLWKYIIENKILPIKNRPIARF